MDRVVHCNPNTYGESAHIFTMTDGGSGGFLPVQHAGFIQSYHFDVRLIGFWNATDGWEWRVLASDFDNGSIS